MLKVLDLFSGIGGFSLGLERTGGFETVAFCEIEKYPQQVLAKHWPGVPIYNDVMELTNERLKADGIFPDIITGGFPCQDISVAGNQKGIGEGTRSGLWSECARLVGEIRPRYAIFENVTALLSGADGGWMQQVLWDLSEVGYDAEWHCIPASQLGAHHHRDRVWIIAYPRLPESQGRIPAKADNDRCGEAGIQQGSESPSPCNDVADTNSIQQSGSIDRVAQGVSTNTNSPNSRNKRQEVGRKDELMGGREAIANNNGIAGDVADTIGNGLQGQREDGGAEGQAGLCSRERWDKIKDLSNAREIWSSEPSICGMADGLSDGVYEGRVTTGVKDRAKRLKTLGNSVVPQIPELIGRAILEASNCTKCEGGNP